ncbi:ATPase family associated with various cellular activities (AAA) [Chitinophaga sp. CF118]|uniref:ATP-binding protein n=1 Tax=Chitinophaga sp. CF118 TaxID=1884367 RepID=UPI0008E7F4F0|nr:ATP-binding protein [Chitinophaga sp. CF118]SFD74148.1 ATPase family associated with various cellular activities (AAA) [Chitinophaga sp. CF118]
MTDNTKNAEVLQAYLTWLQAEMRKRLEQYFSTEKNDPLTEIILPGTSWPDAPLTQFITSNGLNKDEQLLLIMALAPHINAVFFEEVINEFLVDKGDFPLIGCVKGTQFRGLLPTGETFLFLLAGLDLSSRIEKMTLLAEEHLFAKRQILWLEAPPEGEPTMSGRLVLSQEYIDLFLTGAHAKPRFGNDFPAESITTALDWEDLVLNAQTMEQLQELKKWLRVKDKLITKNKRLKPGYRALFYGPPGTGKTLSACLLGKRDPANDTDEDFDVFRIDLSLVVSKFIGETEKNLSRLFDKAEHKNWILFFDEADALFGKRTSIRDAHDKYANQEIAYLLQRIENYNGLVILASNFKNNIDPAFSRRFQSIIQFPMPTQVERLQLWKMILPDEMMQKEGILEKIATTHEISGASIINVAQYCFLKNIQTDGRIEPVSANDVEEGLIREFNKEGKIYK